MISLETYKENLDVLDIFDVKNVNVSKSVINIGDKKVCEEKNSYIPPLAATVLGLNNTAAVLCDPYDPCMTTKPCTRWTDIDAQELYLGAKPTCYLILSKPGAGAYTLGEAISKKLNCVHICPRNVLIDEIEQNSPTGKCIDFNIKHNGVCQIDNIISIMKTKLQSPAIKHRGYIISGLPLVTANWSSQYLFNTLHAEESVLFIDEILFDLIANLKKKKPKTKIDKANSRSSVTSDVKQGEEEAAEEEQLQEEEELGEEEDQPVELPKFILETCADIIFTKKTYVDSKNAVLFYQLKELFNLQMQPDIIVYITYPDADLITKKTHKFINYKTYLNTTEPFGTKAETETRWPTKCSMIDYSNPLDTHSFNPKYHCRQPINFMDRSVEQMCNYKHHILPFVEDKLKDFNPRHIIKLDGRNSIHQMMYHVMEILHTLPLIKPVIIPKPMYMEEAPEDMADFWKSVEELNAIRYETVNFYRIASPWFNRCPVKLKKRKSLSGKPKYAVTFLKHVYLLSALDALILFCRNPRPFLKISHLEPTCRIIVIGTKSSGKTLISECLSWIFDTPIISYKTIFEAAKEQKYFNFAKTILSEIIATIEDARFMKWQTAENEKVEELEQWEYSVQNLLKKYIPLLSEIKKQPEVKTQEQGTGKTIKFFDNYSSLRKQLSFLPFLDDLEECKNTLKNENFRQYAPYHLTREAEKPVTPILGDNDVTEAISAYIADNELEKETEPTPEELMNEVMQMISDIDKVAQETSKFEVSYGKYIIDDFPSDAESWEILSGSKFLPDNTIAMIENRELKPELIEHYMEIENILKNHQERFLLANDPLMKTKLLTKKHSDTKILDVQIIVHDILRGINITDTTENDLSEYTTMFSQFIEKFREDWDMIKLKLEDNYKSFIEVELENKSDIELIDEVLLKLRKSYCIPCEPNDDEEIEDMDEEDETPKDILSYNHPHFLGETNVYCPIAFYDFGVLWVGKSEFFMKYNNRVYKFCKEECMEKFQKDVTKYQMYNKPYKRLPPLRVCVMGCIGSGKTTVSKHIAKELGLIHIDLSEIINSFVMPRHFKKVGRQYENSFTDDPIEEEGVVDFQLGEDDENIISDILSNEPELRRMIYNYFERGAPLLSVLMQKLLKKLWFEDPYSTTGFVLDGFPRLPTDVEDMIQCYCVPDLIIELESNSEITLERLSSKMFKNWKMQQNEAKNKAKKKFDDVKKEWTNMITEKVVIKVICDDIIDNVFSLLHNDDLAKIPSTESVVIDPDADAVKTSELDENLFNAYNEIIQEYPQPVDESEWEKASEVREQIDSRLEGIFETDDENIQAMKDILNEQKVKVVSFDGTKPKTKALRIVLAQLSNLRNRSESYFEQTFIVNYDISEMLLLEGFCFLSKFHRMCPVYIFENPNAILNPYKINRRKGKIYYVVHRAYIYFVNSEENLKKFRTNPLKYITSDNILLYEEYPLRIGVIGPPKSGKSCFAAKLAKRYGLMCISKGIAVRNILENMFWTELASKMAKALHFGECIDTELIMKSVQTIAIDHRTLTHGFVLDGFPDCPSEAMELSKEGLYPLVIFDMSTDKNILMEHSQKEIHYDIIKYLPPYPRPLIEYRFGKWHKNYSRVSDYVSNDCQNIVLLNGNESKWQCIQNANNYIKEIIPKIHHYLINVKSEIVPVDVMCISNAIFQLNISGFKTMCPVCLRKNILKHCGYPVDRKGVVQYKNKLYWICADHMTLVMKQPDDYLSLQEKVNIPEIPAVVKTIDIRLVYENGVCIVTYAENLPRQKIQRGIQKYAASFRGKTYLFCDVICLDKFLAKPHMYYDIAVFKDKVTFPEISLKKMPNIGYLEQTIGNLLTKACCSVNVLRPKYPGLSISLSGLLYIGLYLKIHDPFIDQSVLTPYLKSFKTYEARSKLIMDLGLRLRSMDNPFANYPKCCINPRQLDSGTVCKASSLSSKTNESLISSVSSTSEFKFRLALDN